MNKFIFTANVLSIDPIRFAKTGRPYTCAWVRVNTQTDPYNLPLLLFGKRLVYVMNNLGKEPETPVLVTGMLRKTDKANHLIKSPYYVEVEDLEFRSQAEDEANMKAEIEKYKERKAQGGDEKEISEESREFL